MVAQWLVCWTCDEKVESLSPGQCIHVVFLGKTLNQQIAWGQPDKMLAGNLRWTSIPSRGSRITPSCFILQKQEIGASIEPSGLPNYDWGKLYLTFLPISQG